MQNTRVFRPWFGVFAMLVGLTCVARTAASSANSEPASKRVLVVYSDERLLPANVIVDEAIRSAFAKDATHTIDFHSEFIDVSRFGGEAHERQLVQFLRDKYAERRPDLIITVGQPALSFLLKYRSTLFTPVPIVFTALTEQQIPRDLPDARIVGIPASPDFTSTIELALKMHPQTRQIAVVAGVSAHDLDIADAARQALKPFEKRVQVRWLTNQSIPALQHELSGLPDQTVVLYATLFEDGSGNTFLPRESLAQFAPYSRSPIYGIFDTYLGWGIVGGSMVTFETMGKKATEAGLRILAGEEPQAAVRSQRHHPTPMFDWRQLKRAGLSEVRLPPGSVLRFREYSLWVQYRWRILGVIALCIGQALLIVALVMQLRRRRRADLLRRESDERTRLAVEASPNVMIMVDRGGKIVLTNARVEEVFGYTRDQLIGQSIEILLPEQLREAHIAYRRDFTKAPSARPMGTGRELFGRRIDGSEVPIEVGLNPVRTSEGSFVLASVIDISKRKFAETELTNAYAEIKQLKERLEAENVALRQDLKLLRGVPQIVGRSQCLQRALAQVEQVAATDSTVLLLGETGTGKELFASAIHDLSARRGQPMVRVNCAAIPQTLIESELFGREKGAYTGALTKQIGRFEAAHRSTLFLDEIGELPSDVQVKLLRVLQERKFERLGSSKSIEVDVRIIVATNCNLEMAISDGKFRQDLYYRLSVFPITVPPLRDRKDDVPPLVMSFVEHFSKQMGKQIDSISNADLALLQRYHWPGNVRELRNTVERAMILSRGTQLRIPLLNHNGDASPITVTLYEVERQHILRVLETTGWRVQGVGGAADLLGMKRTTLESRMIKLGIQRPSR